MTTPDDIDALAGEYVLGTLDAAERAVVKARSATETALDDAIHGWEKRLSPLDDATPATVKISTSEKAFTLTLPTASTHARSSIRASVRLTTS